MEATEKIKCKETFIRIGRDLNSAPIISKGTKYMSHYKDKISAHCKKLVPYRVQKDGLAFRCHSQFACAALTFHVIVMTGKIDRVFHK